MSDEQIITLLASALCIAGLLNAWMLYLLHEAVRGWKLASQRVDFKIRVITNQPAVVTTEDAE